MTARRLHAAAKSIFLEALELPEDERAALLDERCAGDGELRQEVESLLRYSAGATQRTPPPPAKQGATRRLKTVGGPPADTVPLGSHPRGRFEAGRVFGGRYRIVAELGRGGMGRVLRAHDLVLDQEVALKILPEGGSSEQLAHEVRLARQVSHPNVCRVFDFGEAEGETFLSMEYVDGEDLGSLLRRIGRLPREKLLDLSHQLCSGLAAAHTAGVLHRDLKPANIMVDGRGRVRITDFGIASVQPLEAADGEAPPDRKLAGTPAYMAPELWQGKPSRASDVYALGLVLYEMATGEQALRAKTPAGYLKLHAESKPITSPRLEQVDAQFEDVVRRCLLPDPAQRPSSAREVAAALPGGDRLQRALDAGETPSPETVAEASGALPVVGRRVALGYLVALALLLGTLVALGDRAFPSRTPWADRSAGAMAERASSLLRQLGHDLPADGDRAWGWRPSFFLDTPDELLFWYRESPDWLVPWGPSPGLAESRVTYYDPPPIEEGAVQMLLESDGRLVTLKVLTGGFSLLSRFPESDEAAPAEPEWDRVLEAVGWSELDGKSLRQVTPQVIPSMYVDAQRAWRGSDPKRPGDFLLEAASLDGRIVLVDLRSADEVDETDEAFEVPLLFRVGDLALEFQWLALWLTAAVLAAINLRARRGDLKGAARLAVLVTLLRLGRWFLASDHAPVYDFFHTLRLGLGTSLLEGAFAWLAYLALEPTVRRLWPHTLVAWSRLLRGRARDPEVARSLLMGAVAGAAWSLAQVADRLLVRGLGLDAEPEILVEWQLQTASAGRQLLANVLTSAVDGIYEGVFVLFLLAALRGLLGRRRWAVAVFIVLQASASTLGGLHPGLSWLTLGLVIGVVGAWVLVRAGLLAYVAALVVSFLLETTPLTLDFGAWYAESGIWAVVLVLAPAIWAATNLASDREILARGNSHISM